MCLSVTNARTEGAAEVAAAYAVLPDLYLLGSLERGVTVYKQQVRAHNLAWALSEIARKDKKLGSRIAVVGGGVAGLTVTACLLSLFGIATVYLFEQLWDLCPLQQGSDTRWLHPGIYDWPTEGSRAPSASLPVLDWTEGRASDVARTILREFGEFSKSFAPGDRLCAFMGLKHFQIDGQKMEISWIAHKATRTGGFFDPGKCEGNIAVFDTIILASGFGLETKTRPYQTDSYWRNEQLAQPKLDGSKQSYLVSGFGDGALVDLCRLTIERFRQDTIVYELFQGRLEQTERRFSDELSKLGRDANTYQLFQELEEDLLKAPMEQLRYRLRKDTQVVLHLRGRKNEAATFPYIFGGYSSFLHRLITYLLYRVGGFALEFSDLATAVARHNISSSNVLCRYGADTNKHLLSLFVDGQILTTRFNEMKRRQTQTAQRLWVPGTFPHY